MIAFLDRWNAQLHCRFCHRAVEGAAKWYHGQYYHQRCFDKLVRVAERTGGIL